ncbi:MAG: hypothetical protein ABL949_10440 [Fimbriimonadaceae bacterium]
MKLVAHLGNVVSLQNSDTGVVTYTFNSLNRLETMPDPLGRKTTYAYDTATTSPPSPTPWAKPPPKSTMGACSKDLQRASPCGAPGHLAPYAPLR